jgi:hypothetical protein
LSAYHFILGTLGVWRVTHLFNSEDGPWDLVMRLRRKAGFGFWGRLLDCFYCLSVWSAALFAVFLGKKTGERLLLWTALSAGAILLEKAIDHWQNNPLTYFYEDKEEHNAMLR